MRRSLRCVVLMLLALMSSPVAAQDVPGLETCTAEKQMERRTGCLQSNDDFLAQTLSKLSREPASQKTLSKLNGVGGSVGRVGKALQELKALGLAEQTNEGWITSAGKP